MAYDNQLAERIRRVLSGRKGVVEQKMFGGIAFMVQGHMCCGVIRDQLVLRLGAEGARDALQEWHTLVMNFTGRPMKGFVYVTSEGHDTDDALKQWIGRALKFVKRSPASGGMSGPV